MLLVGIQHLLGLQLVDVDSLQLGQDEVVQVLGVGQGLYAVQEDQEGVRSQLVGGILKDVLS